MKLDDLKARVHPSQRWHSKMTEREIVALARDMCEFQDIRAPVQGFPGGIPWEMHMRAYEVYAKEYRPQTALIDLYGRGCRGGFGLREMDHFVPNWREDLSERAKLLAKITDLEALAGELGEAGRGAENGLAVLHQYRGLIISCLGGDRDAVRSAEEAFNKAFGQKNTARATLAKLEKARG